MRKISRQDFKGLGKVILYGVMVREDILVTTIPSMGIRPIILTMGQFMATQLMHQQLKMGNA